MTDYRNDVRRALARARGELASADGERLKYAALELRMAIEALTYDRALACKDDFPPSEYEAWQPRKVSILLEIDPSADKFGSLAVGIEPSFGVAPDLMTSLGTKRVLNMGMIKRHYDALGSYLHVQTIKQRKAFAKVNFVKFRARCDLIAGYLTDLLASPVWNAKIGKPPDLSGIVIRDVVADEARASIAWQAKRLLPDRGLTEGQTCRTAPRGKFRDAKGSFA